MMKKIILFTLLFCPSLVLGAQKIPDTISTVDDIIKILERFITWLYSIFLIVAVIFILMAAFTFMQAGGDSKKVDEAKNRLIYAAIAIGVAMISSGVVFIVKQLLTGSV